MTRDFKDIGPSVFVREKPNGAPAKVEESRKVKSVFIALTLLACIGCVIYGVSRALPLVYSAISGSPYFKLSGVDVIGVKNADPRKIGEAIGFQAGSPIFETDLTVVRDRVKSIDWVKDARVQRRLPSKLVITVTEHTPAGVVVTDDGYRFVDPDGELARIDADVSAYPVFFGMKTKREFADGAALAVSLYRGGIISAGCVRSVELKDTIGYTVFTREGVRLCFGWPPFEKKIRKLIAVLPDAQKRGPIQYIYLNIEGRIIVKNGTPAM